MLKITRFEKIRLSNQSEFLKLLFVTLLCCCAGMVSFVSATGSGENLDFLSLLSAIFLNSSFIIKRYCLNIDKFFLFWFLTHTEIVINTSRATIIKTTENRKFEFILIKNLRKIDAISAVKNET